MQRALELVERCDCNAGCPACVGPVLAAQEDDKGPTPRSLALTVLSLLSAERCDLVPTIVMDEAVDLLDEQRIVGLQGPRDDVELAMAPDSLTGLLSWLEAAPPGMRYRHSPQSPE